MKMQFISRNGCQSGTVPTHGIASPLFSQPRTALFQVSVAIYLQRIGKSSNPRATWVFFRREISAFVCAPPQTSSGARRTQFWHCFFCTAEYGHTVFKGRTVSVRVDDEAVVYILGRYRTKDRSLRILLRAITHLCIRFDIILVIDWIKGIENVIPDWLSRPALHRFDTGSLTTLNARLILSARVHVSALECTDPSPVAFLSQLNIIKVTSLHLHVWFDCSLGC